MLKDGGILACNIASAYFSVTDMVTWAFLTTSGLDKCRLQI